MGKNHEILLQNMHFADLNPVDAGWQRCPPGYSFGPYARDYYLIHYVVEGKGVLYNSSGSHSVGKNELFIIRPGEVTTYIADEKEPWHYIWIGFDGALAKRLDSLPDVLPYYENTFLSIPQCAGEASQKELFLTSKVFELMSILSADEKTPPRYEKLAADYISANYIRPIKIEAVAKQIGVKREYLSRLFKAAYGISMQQYLVKTRLKHGAGFLKNGSSVAEAAALCGYEDVFNFSKMFKKEYGISPKEYRGRHLLRVN